MNKKITIQEIQETIKENFHNDQEIDCIYSDDSVNDVIMRIKEHGDEYIRELNKLNMEFPTQKYKRVPRTTRDTFELPKGVRVQSSIFPGDDE